MKWHQYYNKDNLNGTQGQSQGHIDFLQSHQDHYIAYPENMTPDTKITIVCALVQKLQPKMHFCEMAAKIMRLCMAYIKTVQVMFFILRVVKAPASLCKTLV